MTVKTSSPASTNRGQARLEGLFEPPPRTMRDTSITLPLTLIIIFALAGFTFYSLRDWPHAALLLVDTALSVYLLRMFKSKYRFLFLLHPPILLVSSLFFITPFLQIGDGPSYEAVVRRFVDTTSLAFNFDRPLQGQDIFSFFKYMRLGVIPLFLVPEYFFPAPSDAIYYIWQGCFHLMLTVIVVTLARLWGAIDHRHLLFMALFAAVSPSFFDLGGAPTRYGITFFGIFLFFIAYMAASKALKITPLIGLAGGVATIVVSKAPLLLPALVFVVVDQTIVSKYKLNLRMVLLGSATLFALLLLREFFIEKLVFYAEMSKTGAATFSSMTQVPVVGAILKYVYALLSPFPWSEAPLFVEINYGGNWLLFLLHVCSSLFGLYLFFIMILRFRILLKANAELKRSLLYGFIMSLSIIWGATGFHKYLLIYFPFFAPLLAYRVLRVNWLYPFLFVALAEGFVAFVK